MKKRSRLPNVSISCFAMMIFGFGCSKNSFTPIPPPPPGLITTVAFTANNRSFKWVSRDTTSMSSAFTNQTTHFVFWGSDPAYPYYESELYLTIQAGSLSVGTYTDTVGTTTLLENTRHHLVVNNGQGLPIYAAAMQIGDFATITITSIHDGQYADGTFSALMTEYDNVVTPESTPAGTKVKITDGSFTNMEFWQ